MSPQIAKTVVYRHRCHCDNANVVPGEGEADEHRFDVDGEPFPWLITEDGATFSKRGDIYMVTLSVLPMLADPQARGSRIERFTVPEYNVPLIGTRLFPWALTGSYSIAVEPEGIPVLTLTFLAEDLDTDGDVTEIVDPPVRRRVATLGVDERNALWHCEHPTWKAHYAYDANNGGWQYQTEAIGDYWRESTAGHGTVDAASIDPTGQLDPAHLFFVETARIDGERNWLWPNGSNVPMEVPALISTDWPEALR